MDVLNIELPPELKAYAEAQVAAGRFESVSAYVQTLVDQDQQQHAEPDRFAELVRDAHGDLQWREAPLEELIQKGLDSGPGVVADEAYWAQRHEKLLARIEQVKA